ncbi:MCE family protein [Actinophytocola oryzae]|uniref:Phospholipid/cholesterol/gamma-HCH transport system substrate-binding protein n=1 Tax=Actinophytocola oryzae TaxID=502181 RepID=A0A4R7VZY3_9PSEU|nr:MCE family protein [Actinophytocola oryzae]TDV55355.1 phospholipid/cholesterol/gamma-HCH transport system substrate-binding protein [Actinophytocola oryzae]
MRRPSRLAAALAAAALLAGCDGLPLPFRSGVGEDGYQITVHLVDLANLVPNAEVKVDDITVGTVTGVAFDDWTAALTVSLARSVTLPANAEARIGQKSLLGATYLELAPPARGAVGRLRAGDDIPLSRTGRYPETEELLAALSAFLNHGGLAQLKTITAELDDVLVGRTGEVRDLIDNVGTLAATLDAHKGDVVAALANVDRLSAALAEQIPVVDEALRAIPPGLAVLERQRTTLVQALDAVSAFGAVATQVITASQDDLRANLQALQPVLGSLAASGKDLTGSMGILPTFPFATNSAFPAVVNGDYGNLYITVDLDLQTLSQNLLRGFTIAGVPLLGGSSLAGGLVDSNPITGGLADLLPVPPVQAPPPVPPAPQGGGLLGGILGGLLDTLIPGGH